MVGVPRCVVCRRLEVMGRAGRPPPSPPRPDVDVTAGLARLGIRLDQDALDSIVRLGGSDSLQAMARVGLSKDQPSPAQPAARREPPPQLPPPPLAAGSSSTRLNEHVSSDVSAPGHAHKRHSAASLSLSAISQQSAPLLAWDTSTIATTRDPIGTSHTDPLWRIPRKGRRRRGVFTAGVCRGDGGRSTRVPPLPTHPRQKTGEHHRSASLG